jgi:hypothetical protein
MILIKLPKLSAMYFSGFRYWVEYHGETIALFKTDKAAEACLITLNTIYKPVREGTDAKADEDEQPEPDADQQV